ncbi:hypothetical protein LCGC14_2927640, partial [marine sediment metagenome]
MDRKAQHPNTTRSAISGPTPDKQRSFISRAYQVAQMLTMPEWHYPAIVGKYLEGGFKPIEAFCNDIRQNLIYWASEGDSVFYQTPDYWYIFQYVPTVEAFRGTELEGRKMGGHIVYMTRYRNETGTWERLDDWANPHSVKHMLTEFLDAHPDKCLPLRNT